MYYHVGRYLLFRERAVQTRSAQYVSGNPLKRGLLYPKRLDPAKQEKSVLAEKGWQGVSMMQFVGLSAMSNGSPPSPHRFNDARPSVNNIEL